MHSQLLVLPVPACVSLQLVAIQTPIGQQSWLIRLMLLSVVVCMWYVVTLTVVSRLLAVSSKYLPVSERGSFERLYTRVVSCKYANKRQLYDMKDCLHHPMPLGISQSGSHLCSVANCQAVHLIRKNMCKYRIWTPDPIESVQMSRFASQPAGRAG